MDFRPHSSALRSRVILLADTKTVKSSGGTDVNVLLAVTGLRGILLRILRPRNGFLHCPSVTLKVVCLVSKRATSHLNEPLALGLVSSDFPAAFRPEKKVNIERRLD